MPRAELCTYCADPMASACPGNCVGKQAAYDDGAREALEREAKRVDAAIARVEARLKMKPAGSFSRAFIVAELRALHKGKGMSGPDRMHRVLLEILEPETKP